MPDSARLLEVAVSAAKVGGDVLRGYYHDGVTMRNKASDGGKSYDLVSDADLESERAVIETIRRHFPEHQCLGEESQSIDAADAADLWVIDPLDGTNNFAHRLPHFAVSVAYYRHGKALAGAVLNPIGNDLFTATAGGGAFHNGAAIRTSAVETMDQAMIGCGFYYDRGEMMRATLDAIEACFQCDIHGIRRFGTASLDLCSVASGHVDAFFEYKLSFWDFAAGALILREAGGTISTTRGDTLPNATTTVLASNSRLHATMLKITSHHDPT
ncbi:MAG: inositol monophosphatase family protein [Planctomycetota bacterium]